MSVSPSSHKRKARDLNPHHLVRWHALAVRPGKPYPATFRMSVDRPGIEPGFPPRQGGVFPLDHQPVCLSGPMGIEPDHTDCKIKSSSLGHAGPLSREVRPGIEPGLPSLPQTACCHNTYRPFVTSDPGWNRTIALLGVIQASSPLDHGIMFSDQRWESNPQNHRLSTCSLCRFAYLVMFK